MAPENGGDVNAITIQDMLYRMIDITWTKKSVNLAYIQLMCNIMAVRKDLVTITALNVSRIHIKLIVIIIIFCFRDLEIFAIMQYHMT